MNIEKIWTKNIFLLPKKYVDQMTIRYVNERYTDVKRFSVSVTVTLNVTVTITFTEAVKQAISLPMEIRRWK